MNQLPRNTILGGDATEWLRQLPRASVDCVITSPPYYQLRDYGMPGQIGLEPDAHIHRRERSDESAYHPPTRAHTQQRGNNNQAVRVKTITFTPLPAGAQRTRATWGNTHRTKPENARQQCHTGGW